MIGIVSDGLFYRCLGFTGPRLCILTFRTAIIDFALRSADIPTKCDDRVNKGMYGIACFLRYLVGGFVGFISRACIIDPK